MNLQNIILVSFGYFDRDFLRKIAEKIHREYIFPVQIREGHIDLSDFYDPARRQYNANSLLQHMEDHYSPDAVKTIGLFTVDLYITFLLIFSDRHI